MKLLIRSTTAERVKNRKTPAYIGSVGRYAGYISTIHAGYKVLQHQHSCHLIQSANTIPFPGLVVIKQANGFCKKGERYVSSFRTSLIMFNKFVTHHFGM